MCSAELIANRTCDGGNELNIDAMIAAAKQGSAADLGKLLEFYFNYLAVLANTQVDKRLRRRFNPSDLVQETLLAAHRDFKAFRGSTQQELVCWLRQILINVLHGAIAKHVRAEKRDLRREISLDQVQVRIDRSAANLAAIIPGRGPSPSHGMQAEERSLELANQLAKLSDDYRRVIVLRNLQGMAFEEIAEQMDRSCGAVRMLWLRAIDRFREILGEAFSMEETT